MSGGRLDSRMDPGDRSQPDPTAREADPRNHSHLALELKKLDLTEYEHGIKHRYRFAQLSVVWLWSGIVFFIATAALTLYLWATNRVTDLPEGVKWLFGLWGGVQGTGAIALWRPIRHYYSPEGRARPPWAS